MRTARVLLICLYLIALDLNLALGQASARPKNSALNSNFQADEVTALVQKLRVARLQANGLASRHPHYERAQRHVAELEAQLRRLTNRSVQVERSGTAEGFGPSSEADRSASSAEPITARADRSRRVEGTTVAGIDLPPRADPIKPLVSGRSFNLIGGWRLPSAGAGGKGLGFSQGGLHVEHGDGDERHLFVYGHRGTRGIHELKVSLQSYGSDIALRESWPQARAIQHHENSHVIKSNEAYALCRPNPGGPFLTTGRVFYATEPENWKGPWMNWFDPADGNTKVVEVEPQVNRRQVFGGGFCTIPKWFADKYLGGRDFGVGFGGYQSGQTSSPGPTLFVADRPADFATALTNCVELLSFKWRGGKDERERRPPDYGKPLWGPVAENSIGWWQADVIAAGPVWIDTPELTGLCYWSVQGLGDLDYNLQDTVFSKKRRVRLYVYDPTEFVQVIQERKSPREVRGNFYEWELPFDTSPNASRWPIGAFWDADDQLLYVSYRNSGGGKYDVPPVVVVYKVR